MAISTAPQELDRGLGIELADLQACFEPTSSITIIALEGMRSASDHRPYILEQRTSVVAPEHSERVQEFEHKAERLLVQKRGLHIGAYKDFLEGIDEDNEGLFGKHPSPKARCISSRMDETAFKLSVPESRSTSPLS
ncbi:hypothetical protein [Rhizobium etli]|uniref:hypothetical protein n=1 Tax=Rhizobium etli TaxID=29449 RepID=UPI0012FD6177|nr:hypothetical protein [Rhizobium etli]